MSGPDSQWRERCDRYFSSMMEINDQTDTAQTTRRRKETKKRKRKERKYKLRSEESDERFSERFKGQPPHHVTTFTHKTEPLKGPVRWLSGLDIHGTSMLLRARSHLFCLFWITTSVLASIVFGVFVYIFISDYLDKSTVFKVDMSHDSRSPSPLSLVLCNANLLRMTAVTPGSRFYGLKNLTVPALVTSRNVPVQTPSELLAGTDLQEFLTRASLGGDDLPLDDLQAELGHYSAMVADSDWDAVAEAALGLNFDPFPKALRMTASEMKMLGPDVRSDVLQCSKNGRPCRPGELTSESHRDLGHCAVVNLSLEESWFSKAGLTVDVMAEEYIPGLSSTSPGLHVFVRTSADTSPLTPGQGMFVAAGDALQLSLRKAKEVNRLSDDGKCESDVTYSRTQCERRCLESHAARVCGCSLGLDNPLGQRCRVSVQYEFICFRVLEILAETKRLPCECKATCREEYVSVTASSYPWISETSQSQIRRSLEASGIDKNVTDLSKSLSKIEVDLLGGFYEKLKEEEKITLLQLLLNLGAISALTCGVSVVTAIELLWIFGKILSTLCCAVIRKEEAEDEVKILPPASLIRPPHLYNPPDTYRWVAYTGTGPPYPLPNQISTRDIPPTIVMMPPPHHRNLHGDGVDPYYTQSGRPNFYFGNPGYADESGRGGDKDGSSHPNRSARDQSTSGAGENVIVDEVRESSPRVAPTPAALFSHPWERPGRHEPHQTVLKTSEIGDGPAGMPLFNVPNAADPRGIQSGENQNEDLRLHGLSDIGSVSSSEEDGNMAPRSSSPLYRVERKTSMKSKTEKTGQAKGMNEAKPGSIPNGDVQKRPVFTIADTTGSHPDRREQQTVKDHKETGKSTGVATKTAWPEETGQTADRLNHESRSHHKPSGLANGHPFSVALPEQSQFFPRPTPIQPNTWYVPEFQRMEFYDGSHGQVLPGGPAYYMYQGGGALAGYT